MTEGYLVNAWATEVAEVWQVPAAEVIATIWLQLVEDDIKIAQLVEGGPWCPSVCSRGLHDRVSARRWPAVRDLHLEPLSADPGTREL